MLDEEETTLADDETRPYGPAAAVAPEAAALFPAGELATVLSACTEVWNGNLFITGAVPVETARGVYAPARAKLNGEVRVTTPAG